jgi:hypothetical protein
MKSGDADDVPLRFQIGLSVILGMHASSPEGPYMYVVPFVPLSLTRYMHIPAIGRAELEQYTVNYSITNYT